MKRGVQNHPVLFLVASSLAALSVHADDTIRKNVFTDCSSAKIQLAALNEQEKSAFFEYLGRVLVIDSTALQDLLIGQGAISTPMGGIGPDAGRQIVDFPALETNREIAAKRCSLELLLEHPLDARPIISSLFKFSLMSTAPEDLRNRASKALWRTVRHFKDRADAPGSVLPFLMGELAGENGWLAEHLLVELNGTATELVINELRAANSERRNLLGRILVRIDPAGELLRKALRPLLFSESTPAPEGFAAKQLEALDTFSSLLPMSSTSADFLLSMLAEPSADVRARVLHLLSKLDLSGVAGQLSTENVQRFDATWKSSNSGERKLIRALYVQLLSRNEISQGDTEAQIKLSKDSELRRDMLSALVDARGPSDANYELLTAVAYDADPELRIAAFQELRPFKERSSQLVSIFLGVLKTFTRKGDVEYRARLTNAAAPVVAGLAQGKETERLIPYFTELLSDPRVQAEEAVLNVVRLQGVATVPAVLKMLRSNEPVVQLNALRVLEGIQGFDRKRLRELVPFVASERPDVAAQAMRTIDTLVGNDTDLLSALKNPKSGAPYASILQLRKGVDVQTALSTLQSFISAAGCREVAPILKDLGETILALRSPVLKFAERCVGLNELTVDDLPVLQRFRPLSTEEHQTFVSAVEQSQNPASQLALLKLTLGLGVEQSHFIPLLLSLLDSPEVALNARGASYLTLLKDDDGQVHDRLKSVFGRLDDDDNLKLQVAMGILRRDLYHEDARRYLLSHVKRSKFDEVDHAMSILSDKQKEMVLTTLIPLVDGDRRAYVVRKLGELGSAARDSLGWLANCAEDNSFFVRYTATVAMLKIDPSFDRLPDLILKEIKGRYYWSLMAERFPDGAHETFTSLLGRDLSFEERRAIEDLIARTESQKGVK